MNFQEITPFVNSIYVVTELDVNTELMYNKIAVAKDSDGDWIKRGDNRFKTPDRHRMSETYEEMFTKIDPIAIDVIRSWGITADVGLIRYWTQWDESNGYAHAHTHNTCLLSGVFYVSMPEGTGKIVFERPDPQEYYYKGYDTTPYSFKNYWIQPEENMLLLFPSYIRHRVDFHSFTGNKSRVAVAFDYGFVY